MNKLKDTTNSSNNNIIKKKDIKTEKTKDKKISKEKSSKKAIVKENIQYSFKLLVVILEHGNSDEVVEVLKTNNLKMYMVCSGKGTANSQLLGLLGLGDSQRDIIISIIETCNTTNVISNIYQVCQAAGIVFTIRLNSIGGRNCLKLLKGEINGN